MVSFFRRGQASFEYIILTGLLLAVLVPVIYSALSTANTNYRMTKIDDIVTTLVDKANDLYKLGPGNKDTVYLSIPSGITGAFVTGNTINIATKLSGQSQNVSKSTEVQLVGGFDSVQGDYAVAVKAINESLVRIGSGPFLLYLDPSCIGAPNFANPPLVTIYGDDFTLNTLLYKDGAPFDPQYYTVVDNGHIQFTASPTQFNAQPGGAQFIFNVVDGTKTSNTLSFKVFPSPNQCP